MCYILEFIDYILGYDNVCLSECWINENDENELIVSGFGNIYYVKRSIFGRGGLVVYMKNTILNHVHLLKTPFDTCMWFRIDHDFLLSDRDMFMCFCYIPCNAFMVPIFKKGDVNDTNNYRGISFMSCFEKPFTSVINTRLLCWSEENGIGIDAQFGFKPGYGTRDATFVLHGIINQALSNKRKLYCCFMDYKRAFDCIDGTYVLRKLLYHGINGKLIELIKSMYTKFKSCIRNNGKSTETFDVNVGVLQSEALRHFYFPCI